jgi:hypothetical protein
MSRSVAVNLVCNLRHHISVYIYIKQRYGRIWSDGGSGEGCCHFVNVQIDQFDGEDLVLNYNNSKFTLYYRL